MKSNNVLMIGGPKHGSKLAMATPSGYLNYYEAVPMSLTAYEDLADALYPSHGVVSCPIEWIRLGQHKRSVARAPAISRETAEAYFYDVMVDAYDRAARVL